ncbi:MAG: hypothetical protein ABI693_06405 [Bryobacteraceae bacterium]
MTIRWLLSLILATTLHAEFRAGTAKTEITPDLKAHAPVYMAGFDNNRVANAIHDPLYARCVAFAADNRPIVICEADLIGLFLDDTDKIRTAIRAKYPSADTVVAATHDHEGPDTMGQWGAGAGKSGLNEPYNALVVERIAATAIHALDSMRPARARLAEVKSKELDAFIDDTRPPVVHDSNLIVLALDDLAGAPIATVVNWANHPETLGSANTQITADYPHALCARLEHRRGGVAALWNGAVGGMQSPLGAKVSNTKPDSFEMADAIGNRVADLALEAIGHATPAPIDAVVYRETRIRIPVANQDFIMAAKIGLFGGRKAFNADQTTTTPVGLLRFLQTGNPILEVALIPGELYPELSVGGVVRYSGADYPDAPIELGIKTLLTARYRMLIGLANDEIGYIIPKAEWDAKPPYLQGAAKPWYGEVNSVGPEAAPSIVRALSELAR